MEKRNSLGRIVSVILSVIVTCGIGTAAFAFSNLSISGGGSIFQSSGGVISTVTVSDSFGNSVTPILNGYFTNTTSTHLSVTTLAQLPTNTLINSTTVCLSNGTNCQASSAGSDDWVDNTTYLTPVTSSRGLIVYQAVTSTYFEATSTGQVSVFRGFTFTGATGTGLSLSGTLAVASTTVTSINFLNATGAAMAVTGLSQLSNLSATATTLNFLTGSGSIFVNGIVPRKTFTLSGAGAIPALTNGSTAYQVEFAGNGTNYYAQGFDATTTKYASWGPIDMPKCWDQGTMNDVTFEFWTGTSTVASSTVWALQGKSSVSSTYADVAWGSPIFATATQAGRNYTQYTTSSLSNMTLGGTTGATSSVMFRAYRSAAQSDDDSMNSSTLLSIKFTYGCALLSD